MHGHSYLVDVSYSYLLHTVKKQRIAKEGWSSNRWKWGKRGKGKGKRKEIKGDMTDVKRKVGKDKGGKEEKEEWPQYYLID